VVAAARRRASGKHTHANAGPVKAGRPGVASTIIGARRLDQLEQNLSALDVTLSRDEIASLD
jgi:hypothetical protein